MDRVLASVDDCPSEEPWSLPQGWSWTKLGVVAQVNPSTDFGGMEPDATIPFIPMAAVATETGIIDTSARRTVGDVAKGFVRFANGDVIFAKITPCMENGKVAPVHGLPEGLAAGSTEFHVFRPRAVDQRFLWHWLVSRGFRQRAQRNMSGSAGQLRVPVDWLRTADFPLPPLQEQRRIVARIDALFSEIAEGEAALDEARKGLELFRRALLKAAVTGELTRDWRENNSPQETGFDVIASLRSNRPVKRGSKRKSRAVEPSEQCDESSLPALPPAWAWAAIQDVGCIQLGRQRAPQHHNGDHMRPYMRVANVFEDRIDLSDVKSMNFTPAEFEAYRLHDGDILLNEGQTPDLLGRPAIWRNQIEDCCFQNTLIRFRAASGVSPEWALLVFRHYLHAKRFKQESQITTNIAHLSAGRFALIEFPVPPPAEAAEIIRRVTEALAAADDTRKILDAEAADVARLKQSILKAAFEGKLAPQNPADEPASFTLARLKNAPPTAARTRSRRIANRNFST